MGRIMSFNNIYLIYFLCDCLKKKSGDLSPLSKRNSFLLLFTFDLNLIFFSVNTPWIKSSIPCLSIATRKEYKYPIKPR